MLKNVAFAALAAVAVSSVAQANSVAIGTDSSWKVSYSPSGYVDSGYVDAYAYGVGGNDGNNPGWTTAAGTNWIGYDDAQSATSPTYFAPVGDYIFKGTFTPSFSGPYEVDLTFSTDNAPYAIYIDGNDVTGDVTPNLPYPNPDQTYKVKFTVSGAASHNPFDIKFYVHNLDAPGYNETNNPVALVMNGTVTSVVPVPASVFGGLGLLGSVAAYRRLRRGR